MSSPTVYQTSDLFEKYRGELGSVYHAGRSFLRYYSMAVHNYVRNKLADQIRSRIYFYSISAILACRWILANGTAPPVDIKRLADEGLEAWMRDEYMWLLGEKVSAATQERLPRILAWDRWIVDSLMELKDYSEVTWNRHDDAGRWEKLESVFARIIEEQE
jgi:predicted nucleotidyltransferase